MADIRIKDLTTTASTTAADDFFAADGATNGTRKLSAYSPTFGGNATVGGTLTVNSSSTVNGGASGATSYLQIKNNGSSIGLLGSRNAIDGGTATDLGLYVYGANALTLWTNSSVVATFASNGNTTLAGALSVSSTTASTTTSSGALVVGNGTSGGLGVGGNIYAGGSLSASGTTTADGLATSGFFGGSKRVVVGYNTSSDYGFVASVDTGIGWKELHLNPVGGVVKVPNTAASTSTSTGSLVNAGGFGNAGAAFFGGNATVFGAAGITINNVGGAGNDSILTLTQSGVSSAFIKNTATTGDIAIGDGGGTYLRITKGAGVVFVSNTTASTSTSSGALVVGGGVGVAKSLNVGEAVTVAGGSFAAASFYKSASLGTVLSGATGSSYDLYITNPAGNHVMQVPTGTRNAEFAATLTTVGAITSGASISTSAPTGGSGAWELGVYSATAPSATGYVTIEIGGTAYKLLASNV